ncbi:DUF4198 domain-containing protein [Henriciella barbarensis]|uniref:DUF4198 domain-containing protein n=1 Tax=Henriciella barbarensis TaxID=86342 RepID=A0A399QS40_9PROT|nr:DUF4198 domain-containing protein [Henriciella barbarensis]RIJ21623.1 DUF4198 domain-containing protein [Henriciella barbarensis]
MNRMISLSILAAALTAGTAHAHDFWVQPDTFTPEDSGALLVSLFVGHGSDKSDWPLRPHRIVGFQSFGPEGQNNQARGAESLSGDLSVVLDEIGTHLILVETTNSFSELDADKFTSYVEDEGIRPIMLDRAANRAEDHPGKELYSRRGKALVQVGCPDEASDNWGKELGLTLEIVPGANPIDWNVGATMPINVHYHGVPVSGATLHITNLDDDTVHFSAETDVDGVVDISSSLTEGRWLVHTVWAEAADGLLEGADYQTIFSSLTFDTESPCPR